MKSKTKAALAVLSLAAVQTAIDVILERSGHRKIRQDIGNLDERLCDVEDITSTLEENAPCLNFHDDPFDTDDEPVETGDIIHIAMKRPLPNGCSMTNSLDMVLTMPESVKGTWETLSKEIQDACAQYDSDGVSQEIFTVVTTKDEDRLGKFIIGTGTTLEKAHQMLAALTGFDVNDKDEITWSMPKPEREGDILVGLRYTDRCEE